MNLEIPSNDPPMSHCPLCGKEPLCGGMGMIKYSVPVGDPRFGKVFRCPNNPPNEDINLQNRLRNLGNMSAFVDKTFESFQFQGLGYSEEEENTLAVVFRKALDFASYPQGWLVLEGKYGSGKTHLAAAIANTRLGQGEQVVFITVPDLLDYLRSAYAPNAEDTYDALFDRVKNAYLLILDDLGAENPSQWAQEKLFQLLNHRYVNRMPTVITTNVELDRIDGRIRSRMVDPDLCSFHRLNVPDYRRAIENRNQTAIQTDLSRYKHMRFETFSLQGVSPDERTTLESALYTAQRFAQSPNGWLYLSGKFGTGKTHLAVAIAHQCREHGIDVTFITTPDLLDYLRETFHPTSPVRFDERFQAVKNAQVLIIDSFDMTNASTWAKEKIFQVMDYRYISQLPTVITSAVGIAQQEERIRTRLMDDRLCRIEILAGEAYTTRRRRMK